MTACGAILISAAGVPAFLQGWDQTAHAGEVWRETYITGCLGGSQPHTIKALHLQLTNSCQPACWITLRAIAPLPPPLT